MSRRGRKNSDKMYSKTYYSYGSEAYKYYPEVEYDRRRRRNLPIERKVGKAEKYKKAMRNKTHYEFVKEKKGDFRICFSIGTLFTFILAFVCLFAINTQKESEINANISELKKIEEANSVLQAEIAKNINLKEIEEIAKTKLNMQKPASHQIVYINIPKQSYTVLHDTVTVKKEDDFSLTSIWNNLMGD
jgi:cell division protein FtsL